MANMLVLARAMPFPLETRPCKAEVRFGSEADITSPAAGRPGGTSAIGQERT